MESLIMANCCLTLLTSICQNFFIKLPFVDFRHFLSNACAMVHIWEENSLNRFYPRIYNAWFTLKPILIRFTLVWNVSETNLCFGKHFWKNSILHPQAKQLKKTQNIVLLLRFVFIYVFHSHYIIMHFKYASEIISKPSRFDVFHKMFLLQQFQNASTILMTILILIQNI